jgi:peptide/nickel transport system substrate-binding protein
VADFQSQTYQLNKNPNYWQAGKPAFLGLRYLAFPDRNAQGLALVNGQLDWDNGQIANAEQTFVAKDQANRYFVNASGPNMATLALQIAKEPFDDVNVRKAISMAINREQIATVGESGIATPADVTGLAPFYQPWKVADPASLGDWATYDPAKANELLDAAGLAKGADGIRVLPDGSKMEYELPLLPLPNWIADMQIVSENLKEVGISVAPKPVQFPEWRAAQMKGDYAMMFNIIDGNATPYRFFNNTMASALLQPVGTDAFGNSTRYAGKKADDLLAQFAATSDEAKQREIAQQLQQVFAEEVPTLPLFPLSGQGFVSTAKFTGFPSNEDHYALAEPNSAFFADPLLVLTRLQAK